MEKIKILFVTTHNRLPYGGSEVLWSEAAVRLARRGGVSVSALVRRWDPVPQHIKNMQHAGVNIFFHPDGSGKGLARVCMGLERFRALLGRTQARNGLDYGLISSIKPDLVVISSGNHFSGAEVTEICRKNMLKYVNVVQLVTEVHYQGDAALAPVVAAYSGAVLNCFVSKHNADLACQMTGCNIPNICMVRNPPACVCEKIAYPSAVTGWRLACVGRLHSLHKGQDILLGVLRMPKWKERDLVVDCYGDGPYQEHLKRLGVMWGVDKFRFQGRVEDVAGIWQDHHALILPSRMEGQSLALVEAMACGRPCIVTDVGGARELITEPETGFVAEAPTMELLDRAMERAWDRRDEWAGMGVAAHARACDYFKKDPIDEFCGLIEAALIRDQGV